MKVKVTKSFSSIAKASDLHPKFFKPGDIAEDYAADVALAEGWGEKIDGDTDGDHAALAAGAAAGMTAPVIPIVEVPKIKARVTRAVDIPDDTGAEVRYAKGAVVEGQLAERLIAEGFAKLIEGSEAKSLGGAPENK